MNEAPPSPNDLRYVISPSHFSIILRHIASPRPVPPLLVVKFGVNGPDEREKGDGSAAGAVIDDACRDGALEAAQHLCLCAAHGAHAHQEPECTPFAQH